MNMTAFLRGVCVGMVVGAAADMAAHPYPKARKPLWARPCSGWVTLWIRRWSPSHPCCTEGSQMPAAEGNGSLRRCSVQKSRFFREIPS